MKYIREEISKKGKTRHLFAIGRSEAYILHKLLNKAVRYMPRTFTTASTEARLRNMEKVIREAFIDMEGMDDADNYEMPDNN